jgi:OOP family OmpA-OmpF porin
VKVPGRFSRRIFFSNGAASLSARAQAKLTRNAMWLQRHANRNVVVEGHASTTGALAANQKLSEARAKAVKDFLVEQGVDESRIESVGFGMAKPEFKPGSNPKNRRVVVKVKH